MKRNLFAGWFWKFHGKSENIDSARLAGVANVEQSSVWTECEQLRQQVNNHAMLPLVKPERMRHNVSKGYEAHILHDHEILKRRGIWIERYDLPHKVLSNFAHFSEFSHGLMMQTSADWQKSWRPFLPPTFAVASFIAEVIEAFLETFPKARQLLSQDEQTILAKWRAVLRSPY